MARKPNHEPPPRWRNEIALGIAIAIVICLPLLAVTCAAWSAR